MKEFEYYITYQNLGCYSLDEHDNAWSDLLLEATEFEATILENKIYNTITLWLMTEGESAKEVINRTISQVSETGLNLSLKGAAPEFVSINQLSELFDVSKQNIQAYMTGKRGKRKGIPPSPYSGVNDSSIWLLSEAAQWLRNKENHEIADSLIDLGHAIRETNSAHIH